MFHSQQSQSSNGLDYNSVNQHNNLQRQQLSQQRIQPHQYKQQICDQSQNQSQRLFQIQQPDTHTINSKYLSSYLSHYPLYGMDWTSSRSDPYAKIALSSYREDSINKLEILYGIPNALNYTLSPTDINANGDTDTVSNWNFKICFDYNLKYPVTRLQWDPSMNSGNTDSELLATTSECLRIYQIIEDSDPSIPNYIANSNKNSHTQVLNKRLVEKSALTNSKITNLNQLPPMTSFDWNQFDPSSLITCSIDTTCTAWNLVKETFVAKSQLIAHDSEVYDVKYIYGDKNVFTSCSSDGSVRLFDLRNLEQSTIIYDKSNPIKPEETLKTEKLVRLSTSHYNANQIAVLEEGSSRILILDLRNVSVPIYSLNHHAAPVNSIAWHPSKNMLLSGADDCQAFIYDFNNTDNDTNFTESNKDLLPDLKFETEMEVNYVCWNPNGDWVGLNNGKQFQACKV